MRKHLDLLFNISTKSISNVIPFITFPPKIFYKTQTSELIGYFVNYDGSIDFKHLLDEFSKDKGIRLVNSNSHFLLFFLNQEESSVEVLTDHAGTFPLYYTCTSKAIYCSTKFHNVLNYLKSNEEHISIDPDGLMTSLLWNTHATEKTIMYQIKKLPPGCRVTFDLRNPVNTNILSLVDLDGFLENKKDPYSSVAHFSRDWVNGVSAIISDQLSAIDNLTFGCDLSSGFDCTLVAYCLKKMSKKTFSCYSNFSEFTQSETNVRSMIHFAERHGLHLKLSDVGRYHQFKNDFISNLDPEDPHQFRLTRTYNFLNKIAKDGITIQFTGEGGDEIYGSRNMDTMASFTVQQSYFNSIRFLKKDKVGNLFTKKFVDFSLSRKSFNDRNFYSLVIPPTSGVMYWVWGEKIWENDLWLLTPYIDTRLIQLARRVPLRVKGGLGEIKQQILLQTPEIFNTDMFRKKKGLGSIYKNFIYNQRKLIDMVLKCSVLDKLGIISKENIHSLLDNKKSLLYTDQPAITFYNIVLLDWYFQTNNITSVQGWK